VCVSPGPTRIWDVRSIGNFKLITTVTVAVMIFMRVTAGPIDSLRSLASGRMIGSALFGAFSPVRSEVPTSDAIFLVRHSEIVCQSRIHKMLWTVKKEN